MPDPFELYLRKLDYAEQTITATLQMARALELSRESHAQDGGTRDPLPPHWRSHLKRIIAAGEVGVVDAPLATYAHACLEQMDAARAAKKRTAKPAGHLRGGHHRAGTTPRRTHIARSVSDEAWTRLLVELVKPREGRDEGAAAVLGVQAGTALRVGDVLRIPRAVLSKGVQAGALELTQKGGREHTVYVSGAPAAWARLAAYCAAQPRALTNVAACVSGKSPLASSSGTAYKRCANLLHQLEQELGTDRLHTHRLRRTFAVQVLRETGDVHAVAEILQHVPGSQATLTYHDEAQAERVAQPKRSPR